jgi:hypothetical protein
LFFFSGRYYYYVLINNSHFSDSKSADSVRYLTATMQGRHNLWFAGAWLNAGFHEDGFVSGVVAAKGILNALSLEEETLARTNEQQESIDATSADVKNKKKVVSPGAFRSRLGDSIPLYPSHGDCFHPLVHRVTGRTRHVRTQPHQHAFNYDIGMYYFSLDSPPYGMLSERVRDCVVFASAFILSFFFFSFSYSMLISLTFRLPTHRLLWRSEHGAARMRETRSATIARLLSVRSRGHGR